MHVKITSLEANNTWYLSSVFLLTKLSSNVTKFMRLNIIQMVQLRDTEFIFLLRLHSNEGSYFFIDIFSYVK